MPRLRASILGCVLVLTLAVAGGCSGDDDDGDSNGAGSGDEQSIAGVSASPASSAQSQATVESLIATGLGQVDHQQLAAAASTFQTALDLDGHNVYALYNLGYIAQTQGDDGLAIQRYTQALTAQADFAPALYNLAILTEPSDLNGAVALYRRVVEVKPDDAAAHMRLGFALGHLGREAEAERMLARGIELDPAMADVESPVYP